METGITGTCRPNEINTLFTTLHCTTEFFTNIPIGASFIGFNGGLTCTTTSVHTSRYIDRSDIVASMENSELALWDPAKMLASARCVALPWPFFSLAQRVVQLKRVPHPATKLDDITVSGKIFDKRDKVNVCESKEGPRQEFLKFKNDVSSLFLLIFHAEDGLVPSSSLSTFSFFSDNMCLSQSLFHHHDGRPSQSYNQHRLRHPSC